MCITADAMRGGGGTIDRNRTLRAGSDQVQRGRVSLGLPDRVADGLFAGLLAIVAMRMSWDLYRSRGDGTKAVPYS